jgi:hypothetical protein
MTAGQGGSSSGSVADQDTIAIIDDQHPLAAGKAVGSVKVTSAKTTLNWGAPSASAIKIATLVDQPAKHAIFAYEAGAAMATGSAPARRVGWFARADLPPLLTADGWKLFEAAVLWGAGRNGQGGELCALPRSIRTAGRLDATVARADPDWSGLIDGLKATPDIAPNLQALSTMCGLDVSTQIDTVLVGWSSLGWLPFAAHSSDFAVLIKGTFDAVKLRRCLDGSVAGTAAPSFDHRGVSIYGGDGGRPFFALLDSRTLAFASTQAWVVELVENHQAPASACSGTNATLASLVKRADPAAALWLISTINAADQEIMLDSEALAWAKKSTQMISHFKSAGGLSILLDLTTAQDADANEILAKAQPTLADIGRPPTATLETLLGNTAVTKPAPSQVRFRTTLSLDLFRQLIGLLTLSTACVNGHLNAGLTFNPAAVHDAELTLPQARDFKIPTHLRALVGNGGNAEALLSFRLGEGATVTCRYRAGASTAHPTDPADVELGRTYTLVQPCSNGAPAGAQARASWFKLHLEGADAQAGKATVRAPLVCL